MAMHRRTTGFSRRAAIGNRRQGLVINHHQGRRILGDVAGLGDHRGDRLADKADLIGGQDVGPGRGREAVDHLVRRNMVRGQRPNHVGVRINRVDTAPPMYRLN